MNFRLFILLYAAAEVVAVVASFKLLGFWATLGMCFLAMIAGGALLQRQSLATAERFVGQLEAGQPPMDTAWSGFCLMVAAVLFIIPGFVSDALALLLLVPFVQRALLRLLRRSGLAEGNYWFDAKVLKVPERGEVIEADYEIISGPGPGSQK